MESDSRSSSSDIVGSQHVLVCALHELGSLVLRLGTSASQLVAEPATGSNLINPSVSMIERYFQKNVDDTVFSKIFNSK